jgi:aldose 1-epimerase
LFANFNSNCDRIANGEFDLNGRTYRLARNHGGLCLHGGIRNFSRRVWSVKDKQDNRVVFELISEDGDEGFPGAIRVQVAYELQDDDRLVITYRARLEPGAQVQTIVNLTNHTYFNLNGSLSGRDVRNHILHVPHQLSVLELNDQLVPSGRQLNLDHNSLLDFRRPKCLGEGIDSDSNLYDCNLVIRSDIDSIEGAIDTKLAAELSSPITQIRLRMLTSEPGFQLYTGRHIHVDQFVAFSGVALEAQRFPNACNNSSWTRQTLLSSGQEYRQTTVYAFDRLLPSP